MFRARVPKLEMSLGIKRIKILAMEKRRISPRGYEVQKFSLGYIFRKK